jgi:hypothetical protein
VRDFVTAPSRWKETGILFSLSLSLCNGRGGGGGEGGRIVGGEMGGWRLKKESEDGGGDEW